MGLPNPAWVSLANLVSHMEIWAKKDKAIYCSALKFRQKCQPQIHLEMFVEIFAPMGEIVEQKGTSCRRLVLTPLKSSSFEIRISSFVPPNEVLGWVRFRRALCSPNEDFVRPHLILNNVANQKLRDFAPKT
jgi:hypothetical protein